MVLLPDLPGPAEAAVHDELRAAAKHLSRALDHLGDDEAGRAWAREITAVGEDVGRFTVRLQRPRRWWAAR